MLLSLRGVVEWSVLGRVVLGFWDVVLVKGRACVAARRVIAKTAATGQSGTTCKINKTLMRRKRHSKQQYITVHLYTTKPTPYFSFEPQKHFVFCLTNTVILKLGVMASKRTMRR